MGKWNPIETAPFGEWVEVKSKGGVVERAVKSESQWWKIVLGCPMTTNYTPVSWRPLAEERERITMTFGDLRAANVLRCEQVFHKVEAWSPQEWACALAGETGEVCNLVKKLKRHKEGTNTGKDPQTDEEFKVAIAMELADVILYADLLAARLDINLSAAVRAKFNEVSLRMNSDIKL